MDGGGDAGVSALRPCFSFEAAPTFASGGVVAGASGNLDEAEEEEEDDGGESSDIADDDREWADGLSTILGACGSTLSPEKRTDGDGEGGDGGGEIGGSGAAVVSTREEKHSAEAIGSVGSLHLQRGLSGGLSLPPPPGNGRANFLRTVSLDTQALQADSLRAAVASQATSRPALTSEGSGGVYMLSQPDSHGVSVCAVFKPADEEVRWERGGETEGGRKKGGEDERERGPEDESDREKERVLRVGGYKRERPPPCSVCCMCRTKNVGSTQTLHS